MIYTKYTKANVIIYYIIQNIVLNVDFLTIFCYIIKNKEKGSVFMSMKAEFTQKLPCITISN